jgi:hypothetical protein
LKTLGLHVEDKAELLATMARIEEEAQALLASVKGPEMASVQQIAVLARYVREHLEMIGNVDNRLNTSGS